MGGGDLNLKKSWHPSTMRNMEKVWKAEQKHDQEKRRIAELQREIREEREREDIQKHAEEQGVIEKKNEMKLEWMYKGPGGIVDREEYLLGRAIDKTFEQLQETEKPSTSSKGVLERTGGVPVSNEQVDLARKLQEDPLFVIKKKELESKTQILKNPMKLKKLQKLLKAEKSEKERKHKKTKKKKKRRKGSSSSSSSSESEDLDALLAAKYIKLKNKLHDMDVEKLKKSEADGNKRKRKSSDDDDSDDERHSRKKYGLQRMGENKPVHTTASRNNTPREKQPSQKQYVKPERKKLTEEEMERRRQEMMQFAKERDEERKNNVARYKAQEEREKKQNKGGYSEDFMRKELSKAAALGTVESRIKSNINNIQRSRSDMDTNFARR